MLQCYFDEDVTETTESEVHVHVLRRDLYMYIGSGRILRTRWNLTRSEMLTGSDIQGSGWGNARPYVILTIFQSCLYTLLRCCYNTTDSVYLLHTCTGLSFTWS
jgi:hypothetical protein